MYIKVLIFLIFLIGFHIWAANARSLRPIVHEKNAATSVNGTVTDENAFDGNEWTGLLSWIFSWTSLLWAAESLFRWYVKRFKSKPSAIYFYVVFVILISQSAATCLSFMAIEGATNLWALFASFIMLLTCCHFFYFLVASQYLNKNELRKNYKFIVIFLTIILTFSIIKLYLYHMCQKENVSRGHIMGSYFTVICYTFIPFIASLYCETFLKYIPNWCSKLGNIILSINDFKQLEMSNGLYSVFEHDDDIMYQPNVNIFGNIETKTCFIRLTNNTLFKCVKTDSDKSSEVFLGTNNDGSFIIQYVLMIRNAIRISDGRVVNLEFIIKNETAAKEYKKIFDKIFDGGLPTVPSNFWC